MLLRILRLRTVTTTIEKDTPAQKTLEIGCSWTTKLLAFQWLSHQEPCAYCTHWIFLNKWLSRTDENVQICGRSHACRRIHTSTLLQTRAEIQSASVLLMLARLMALKSTNHNWRHNTLMSFVKKWKCTCDDPNLHWFEHILHGCYQEQIPT